MAVIDVQGAPVRNGIDPATRGRRPLKYTFEDDGQVIIEKDVAIPMRDGKNIYCNVYRPSREKAPAIINYAPFGKDRKMDWEAAFPGADCPVDQLSEETCFECFDTVNFAKDHGYAIVVVDARGTWYSEGDPHYFMPQEGEDGYDIVEWLAAQEWCTGKVCWGGISYLGMSSWNTAAQQPPHLACIVPWDAASDCYRECYTQGGIPMVPFNTGWMDMTGVSLSKNVEDLGAAILSHPLFDDFWNKRVADWSRIHIPCYSVTEWGNDLHLRGTLEAWKKIPSSEKYLSILAGKEWSLFYQPEQQEHLLKFLDHYLKGADTGIEAEPRVRYIVREGDGRGCGMAYAEDFPLPETVYRTFYLDCTNGTLQDQLPEVSGTSIYDANDVRDFLTFDYRFEARTEICGYANLELWIKPESMPDGDVFVTLEKLDKTGKRVEYVFSQLEEDGPMTHGYLRLSHRDTDELRSTRYQPYHTHTNFHFVDIYNPVKVEIEIWPTSAVFEPGESLRIQIGGNFVYDTPAVVMSEHYCPSHNYGKYQIYSGAGYESNLYIATKPENEEER